MATVELVNATARSADPDASWAKIASSWLLASPDFTTSGLPIAFPGFSSNSLGPPEPLGWSSKCRLTTPPDRSRHPISRIAPAQALAYLLGFKDQAVADTSLPRCIAQVVTMPTSPGAAARPKYLQHFSAASAYEERSPPTKVPRCPSHGECLTIKGDRRVVPVLWLDACAKELVTGIEPISLCFTYVRCLAQVTDVDASGLLDGSSAVSTSSRHRSNTLWRHGLSASIRAPLRLCFAVGSPWLGDGRGAVRAGS